jgi:hypothetical protein
MFILFFSAFQSAHAQTPITLFNTQDGNYTIPLSRVTQLVNNYINLNNYRRVKIQVINNATHQPDHILVYLFSKKYQRFTITKINITPDYQAINIEKNYQLNAMDLSQQPSIQKHFPHCPLQSTQLLVIGPNNIHAQLAGALAVADAGKQAHLNTVKLLRSNATRKNILNYMRCPRLIGIYYVGDGNDNLISAIDGVIDTNDFKKYLKNQFHHTVTIAFSSAYGFQDPLKTTMTNDTQAQKYIASYDPLYTGFPDKTASCTMTAIIENPAQDINVAFQGCYAAYGSLGDHWGIAGDGSNYFGR